MNLINKIFRFLRTKTDLEITVTALAQSLYTRGLNSFNRMDDCAQRYWIEKASNTNLGMLVDEEIKRGKTDKKWVKQAMQSAEKYLRVNNIEV